ncbi:MAG: AlpA family phage regulatory protein [Betaproteobacteria bacterium]|nr:AlpA family phage regulatory protein [Betaproteobacteria bacterium]
MIPFYFMPLPELERTTGQGKSLIYEKLNPKSDKYDPDFPKPVVLSRRCVRWRSDEVRAWMDARSADRDVGHSERQEQARNAGKASAAKRKASAIELASKA